MNPVIDNSTAQATAVQTDVNDDLAKALASVQAGSQSVAQGSPVDNVQDTQDTMAFETVGEPVMAGVPVTPAPMLPVDEPIETPIVNPASIPAAPIMTASPVPAPVPVQDPSDTVVEYSTPPASIDHTAGPAPVASSADSIEQIKISALSQLRPLMQHIELSPEEKFEKYLMMLRASDDQELIPPTYEAAQLISSEKLKAQALLDVINEINYLTSQQLVA